ncbi:MAG: enoyl-CoA hydratase/isomerase family protein [Deltaproteobacteria bacterium]|nr:enoyl-CoA hydratase/isomerase family protein [Deltaproteobacteria bacterium]MBW2025446.1 enoyl-CoA hydratase/isomerase family protein [Deltaproteobacteria bacterium]MBW2126897.1 enoyl-CoA hydratase/isomerase family protein [Deltaproteobacteria bacterium]
MEFKAIIYEYDKNVAWITLNRPDVLNSLNEGMKSELKVAFERANEDDSVYVIVLTGVGDRAFSAGGDVGEFVQLSPLDFEKVNRGRRARFEPVRECIKPVIAMVNGFALGGGCELAMSCDIIVAAEEARFGLPEINVGLIPGAAGTQLLPRVAGEKKAKELIFTVDFIFAQEALRLGLVNRVVPRQRLREAVEEIVGKIKKKSPAILKFAKLSINQSLETPLSVGLGWETDLCAMCF